MRTIRAGGLATNVEVLDPVGPPAGVTAVLVHGLPGDSLASWYFTVAGPLAAAGIRVVMYDLRGHGRTERPATGYRLDDFTDDLAALLDVLCPGERVHLAGHSFGAAVCFAYAVRAPDRVAGIAAVDAGPPTAAFVRAGVDFHAATRAALEAGQAAHGVRALYDRAQALFAGTTFAADLLAGRPLTPDELTAVRCPVLAFFGGASGMMAYRDELRALLPHAETVVLPDLDHHEVLLRGSRQIAARLIGWAQPPVWQRI